jgi:hypothetical protein
MAERKKAAPRSERQDVIIHLPDTEELAAAKLSQDDIERLVRNMLGDEKKGGAGPHLGKVAGITIKGSAAVAKALGGASTEADPPPGWAARTAWRKACSK